MGFVKDYTVCTGAAMGSTIEGTNETARSGAVNTNSEPDGRPSLERATALVDNTIPAHPRNIHTPNNITQFSAYANRRKSALPELARIRLSDGAHFVVHLEPDQNRTVLVHWHPDSSAPLTAMFVPDEDVERIIGAIAFARHRTEAGAS